MDIKNKRRDELIRHLENGNFKTLGDGRILVDDVQLFTAGFRLDAWHNGVQFEFGRKNIVPNAALSYLLRAALAGGTQISSWYVAPFSNAVTPTSALTAANFEATLDEFTNYTQSARPAWAQDTEASQAIANAAVLASITADTGGGTVNGICLLSVSTKGASTGTLFSGIRFGGPRTMLETDTLDFKLTVAASSS
jgi:hypothetical protein